MQFSQKSLQHMDSCRFCWMCRHICPIGNATGQERNTSRARALALSLVARDAVDYSEDIINNVYECSLCGACVKECVTGWDPVMFAKEARLVAALEGKLPEYIVKMVTNLNEKGNIYGAELDSALKAKLDSMKGADTVLFLGADARYKCPENALRAIELLEKAGVNFTAMTDEADSGYSMDFMLGAAAETKAVMENCAKSLASAKKVVCYDPADAKVMLREYKEWGIEMNAEVVTFTAFVASLIADGSLKVKANGAKYTPQDTFLLARDLEETEPVRNILSALGNVSEMLNHGKDTMLAGNLIMNEYMPAVMEQVARDRWTNAVNMNTEILVTSSPAENVLLKA
ncbi:MAG: (Fe-S)-binding protein, partial [Clostridia bacterium]|nr:(Fe-S)-binding protein [Clostridia bacterium]